MSADLCSSSPLTDSLQKFLSGPIGSTDKGIKDLEEHNAHMFLERRGETLTAAALRDILKEIDVDNNHRVAFIEYALFK
jgi:hypothetical protein